MHVHDQTISVYVSVDLYSNGRMSRVSIATILSTRKKTGSGYTKRVLVETCFSRYKKIIGPALHSRNLANQKTEVRIGAKIINMMTHLGMPESYKV